MLLQSEKKGKKKLKKKFLFFFFFLKKKERILIFVHINSIGVSWHPGESRNGIWKPVSA